MENEVAEKLERHRAFWRREKVDRPMTAVIQYSTVAFKQLPMADGSTLPDRRLHLTSEMLDARTFLDSETGGTTPGRTLHGDPFPVRAPYLRLPWVEGILGCPVEMDGSSGSIWSEPFLRDVHDLGSLASWQDSGWYRLLLDQIRWLLKSSEGSFLVADAVLRGPIDLVRAVLGDEPMCLAIYEAPDAFRALLDAVSDVFVEVVKGQHEIIPLFHGGHCSPFGIWAPGRIVRSQCDMASILSPRTFKEVVLPFEEKIYRQFDYSILHVHSTYLHMMDALLAAELPNAIELFLDASSEFVNARELVPVCKKILERKSLILEGHMRVADFEYFVEALPSAGLYVRADLDPEEFTRWKLSAEGGQPWRQ